MAKTPLPPRLKPPQGFQKGLLGLAPPLPVGRLEAPPPGCFSLLPPRGSTRARAAGDSWLRSGLPVPDTGHTFAPSSGGRSIFQTYEVTDSVTYRLPDSQTSRLCNFRTHVVCQFGEPRGASPRRNWQAFNRGPGHLGLIPTEKTRTPAPREGLGATGSPLPLSPCPDLSLSGPFGELHLKAAFQGLGHFAEERLAHRVDGDGASAYLKKVRR
jgi:hypothetical protein